MLSRSYVLLPYLHGLVRSPTIHVVLVGCCIWYISVLLTCVGVARHVILARCARCSRLHPHRLLSATNARYAGSDPPKLGGDSRYFNAVKRAGVVQRLVLPSGQEFREMVRKVQWVGASRQCGLVCRVKVSSWRRTFYSRLQRQARV